MENVIFPRKFNTMMRCKSLLISKNSYPHIYMDNRSDSLSTSRPQDFQRDIHKNLSISFSLHALFSGEDP